MTDLNSKRGAVLKWIIALCLTATLAIVGWTTTVNLAARMRALEEIKAVSAQLNASVAANNVRISVLENKYDTIQATLLEIKVILQKLQNEGRP